ncbi:MAG: hypothetical protein ACE1ZO_02945, partial [Nitrospirales bacterium]
RSMRSPRALPDRCLSTQTGEVILARTLSKRASYAGNVGPSGFPGGRMPLHKNRSGVLNI